MSHRLHAHGTITTAAGVSTLATPDGSISAILRNGAGDHTITLREGIGAAEGIERVSIQGVAPLIWACEFVSVTQRRVRFQDAAGVATDATSFKFSVQRTVN